MDLTEMIAALEQALALSPDNAPLRLQLAAMCANAERWPDAEAHYKHVLGNDPADQKAKLGLAKVFQRTDRLSAALVIYDELYDRGVRDPELLLALSRALVREGSERKGLCRAGGGRPELRRVPYHGTARRWLRRAGRYDGGSACVGTPARGHRLHRSTRHRDTTE